MSLGEDACPGTGWRLSLLVALGFAIVFGTWLSLAPEGSLRDSLTFIDPDQTRRSPTAAQLSIVRFAGLALALGALVAAMAVHHWRDRFPRRDIRGQDAAPTTATLSSAIAWALLGLVGIGVAMRCSIAVSRPIGPDEAINYVFFASRSYLDVISDYHIPNNHVLNTILVRALTESFGLHPFVPRIPALLAGILCIPATFLLGRKLFGSGVAIWAAAIVAVAAPLVEFSADARGYTLQALALLGVFIYAARLCERSSFGGWAGLCLWATIGLYVLPTTVYGVAAAGVWIVLAGGANRRSLLRQGVVAALAVLVMVIVLYLPVLLRGGGGLIENSNTHPIPLSQLVPRLPSYLLGVVKDWTAPIPLLFGSLLAIGWVAALLKIGQRGGGGLLLIASVAIGLLPLFLIQKLLPPQRILVFSFPLLAIVSCAGWAGLIRSIHFPSSFSVFEAEATGRRAALVVAVIWAALSWNKSPTCIEVSFPDSEQIVLDFAAGLGPEKVIVTQPYSGIASPGRYYLMKSGYSPRLMHAFVERRGLEQLDPYASVLIAFRHPLDLAEDLAALGITQRVLEREFNAPTKLRTYDKATIYLLERASGRPIGETPYPEDPWGFDPLW